MLPLAKKISSMGIFVKKYLTAIRTPTPFPTCKKSWIHLWGMSSYFNEYIAVKSQRRFVWVVHIYPSCLTSPLKFYSLTSLLTVGGDTVQCGIVTPS